eukprot:8451581-Pyramimonas_sp.AAC.1
MQEWKRIFEELGGYAKDFVISARCEDPKDIRADIFMLRLQSMFLGQSDVLARSFQLDKDAFLQKELAS